MTSTTPTSSLTVSGLSAGYGRIQVVADVSFEVNAGEFVAIVGRNGAGKTTSLAAVSGLRYGPGGGTIKIDDTDLSTSSSVQIVRSGLSLVREGRRIFRDMTVTENLRLGAYVHRRQGRKGIDADLERVRDLFPSMRVQASKLVGQLSGGQQQMVAVGQALMSRPKFLLLDEPASGLAPALVDEMYDRLRQLVTEQNLGIAIVDQSIERIIDHSDRFYVFENGGTALTGESNSSVTENINAIVLGIVATAQPAVQAS
jgi:branched-chain amino acid transport system ATP-binding protein